MDYSTRYGAKRLEGDLDPIPYCGESLVHSSNNWAKSREGIFAVRELTRPKPHVLPGHGDDSSIVSSEVNKRELIARGMSLHESEY